MERTRDVQIGDHPPLEQMAEEIMALRGTKNVLVKKEKEKMSYLKDYLEPLKEEFEDVKEFLFPSCVITISSGTTTDTKVMREYLLAHGVPGEVLEEAMRVAEKSSERILIKENKD